MELQGHKQGERAAPDGTAQAERPPPQMLAHGLESWKQPRAPSGTSNTESPILCLRQPVPVETSLCPSVW